MPHHNWIAIAVAIITPLVAGILVMARANGHKNPDA
jgi:hypothetical protein